MWIISKTSNKLTSQNQIDRNTQPKAWTSCHWASSWVRKCENMRSKKKFGPFSIKLIQVKFVNGQTWCQTYNVRRIWKIIIDIFERQVRSPLPARTAHAHPHRGLPLDRGGWGGKKDQKQPSDYENFWKRLLWKDFFERNFEIIQDEENGLEEEEAEEGEDPGDMFNLDAGRIFF